MLFKVISFIGILLLVSGTIHLLNINEILMAVKTGDISAGYAPSAVPMWIFAGISMALIGVWLMFVSRSVRKDISAARWQSAIIGFVLVLFGTGSWYFYRSSLHFLLFACYGLVLLVAVFARLFRKSQGKLSTD